ncbi:MAG: hypothetical protein DHS20C18_50300 [Saprospiraceae bacterium]|nr:MAG: hypothetical protein DHS20C18_50300 [Saprospiraceae bacterium]
MNLKLLLSLFLLIVLAGCKKEASLSSQEPVERTVKFVDFEESCNWNLEILDGTEVPNFQGTHSSKFLYANIGDFNQDGAFQIGDTLRVKFEVLSENPYPQRFILCNTYEGVPVKIWAIE